MSFPCQLGMSGKYPSFNVFPGKDTPYSLCTSLLMQYCTVQCTYSVPKSFQTLENRLYHPKICQVVSFDYFLTTPLKTPLFASHGILTFEPKFLPKKIEPRNQIHPHKPLCPHLSNINHNTKELHVRQNNHTDI